VPRFRHRDLVGNELELGLFLHLTGLILDAGECLLTLALFVPADPHHGRHCEQERDQDCNSDKLFIREQALIDFWLLTRATRSELALPSRDKSYVVEFLESGIIIVPVFFIGDLATFDAKIVQAHGLLELSLEFVRILMLIIDNSGVVLFKELSELLANFL